MIVSLGTVANLALNFCIQCDVNEVVIDYTFKANRKVPELFSVMIFVMIIGLSVAYLTLEPGSWVLIGLKRSSRQDF